jgi:hypothetical protein
MLSKSYGERGVKIIVPGKTRRSPAPCDDVVERPAEGGGVRSARREVRSTMASARYELRVNGRLSERARSAFCTMDVQDLPPQTIVCGELDDRSDLRELLALCSAMGLEVVSLHRLPD